MTSHKKSLFFSLCTTLNQPILWPHVANKSSEKKFQLFHEVVENSFLIIVNLWEFGLIRFMWGSSSPTSPLEFGIHFHRITYSQLYATCALKLIYNSPLYKSSMRNPYFRGIEESSHKQIYSKLVCATVEFYCWKIFISVWENNSGFYLCHIWIFFYWEKSVFFFALFTR